MSNFAMEDLWAAVVERYGSVAEFARNQEDDRLSGCEDLSSEMDALRSLSVYQGFDPEETMKRLAAANLAAVTSESRYPLSSQPDPATGQIPVLRGNAKLSTDIRMLLTIFAMRGTDYEKLTVKSKDEFSAVVAHLYKKYGIRMAKTAPGAKKSLPPEVITLPRIAAVAPHILTNLYHTGNAKTIFDIRKLGDDAKSVLGTTFLASCFPHVILNKMREAHRVLFSIHVLSDRIIHRKTGKFTEFGDMVNYYMAAIRSNAVREDRKLEWCRKWGIIQIPGKAQPRVKPTSARKAVIGPEDFEQFDWNRVEYSEWFVSCISSCVGNVKDSLLGSDIAEFVKVISQLETELV